MAPSDEANGVRTSHEPLPKLADDKTASSNIYQTVSVDNGSLIPVDGAEYKVYKRRFFGLFIVAILSMMVTWAWATFSVIITFVAEHFDTTETTINWFSITWLLAAFVANVPAAWAMRKGSKFSLVVGGSLMLFSSWLKYGGTRIQNIGLAMFGQMLSGLACPFVTNLPVLYSNEWFAPKTRATATAAASLANGFGAVMASLIVPHWAFAAEDVTRTVLYISIITTVFSVAAFFLPSKPPTPPSHAVRIEQQPVMEELKWLFKSPEYYLIAVSFSIMTGLFNSMSTLFFQMLLPYGYTPAKAGVASALMAGVGLATCLIWGPVADKFRCHLWIIRIVQFFSLGMFIAFIWVPSSRNVAFCYVISALIGVFSSGPFPVILEFLAEIIYPVGVEIAVTVMWAGTELFGAIFIIAMGYMKDSEGTLQPAIYLQTALVAVVVVLYNCLGLFGRGEHVKLKRLRVDDANERVHGQLAQGRKSPELV